MRMFQLMCLFWCGLATTSLASVIVDHPHNPARSGAYSNLEPGHQQTAVDFDLPESALILSIAWNGRYGSNLALTDPVSFSVRFFEDDGGIPATVPLAKFDVYVNAAETGTNYLGLDWLSYVANVTLTLDSGSYWVSVVESDDRTPASGSTQWLWGHSDSVGISANRAIDDSAWSEGNRTSHAFRLLSTRTGTHEVPVFSNLILVLLAALLMVIAAARHKYRLH